MKTDKHPKIPPSQTNCCFAETNKNTQQEFTLDCRKKNLSNIQKKKGLCFFHTSSSCQQRLTGLRREGGVCVALQKGVFVHRKHPSQTTAHWDFTQANNATT